jgi:hypothetical protein
LAIHLADDPVGSQLRAQVEELMIHLLQSPSPVLRFWSCFGVGTLKCERSICVLREIAQNDQGLCPGWWYVREEAEDALEWIAGKAGKERIPLLARKANDSDTLA